MIENLGYAVNDLAGIITEISTAYANVLGYRPCDIVGRNFREFIAPEISVRADQCFMHVIELGARDFRAVYALPDGDRLAMHISLMPVRTEKGVLVSVLIIPQAGSLVPQFKRGSVHSVRGREDLLGAVKP